MAARTLTQPAHETQIVLQDDYLFNALSDNTKLTLRPVPIKVADQGNNLDPNEKWRRSIRFRYSITLNYIATINEPEEGPPIEPPSSVAFTLRHATLDPLLVINCPATTINWVGTPQTVTIQDSSNLTNWTHNFTTPFPYAIPGDFKLYIEINNQGPQEIASFIMPYTLLNNWYFPVSLYEVPPYIVLGDGPVVGAQIQPTVAIYPELDINGNEFTTKYIIETNFNILKTGPQMNTGSTDLLYTLNSSNKTLSIANTESGAITASGVRRYFVNYDTDSEISNEWTISNITIGVDTGS